MPELHAYEMFTLLLADHVPTYFHFDQKANEIGVLAGSCLSWDVLRICDNELFDHLKLCDIHFIHIPVKTLHTHWKPFAEVPKLWDFFFCFGFHLNPVVTAANLLWTGKSYYKRVWGIIEVY